MAIRFNLTLLLTFVLAGSGLSMVQAQIFPSPEKQKIETLIKQVGNLKTLSFCATDRPITRDRAAVFLAASGKPTRPK